MGKEMEHPNKINPRLTELIIGLHEQGYTEDFFMEGQAIYLTAGEKQMNLCLPFTIKDIDEYYDSLNRKYRYVQTVETSCGIKGILISDVVRDNKQELFRNAIG